MADIYDVVLRHDLKLLSTEELKDIARDAEEASVGLALGMKTIGKMAFYAYADNECDDSQLREYLGGIGDLLMYLPRIVSGIQQNLLTAQYEISRRGEKS